MSEKPSEPTGLPPLPDLPSTPELHPPQEGPEIGPPPPFEPTPIPERTDPPEFFREEPEPSEEPEIEID